MSKKTAAAKQAAMLLLIPVLATAAMLFVFWLSADRDDAHAYISPEQAVRELTPGWNLGNTLDAVPTEGAWGNKASERNFDDIKAAGFRSVRIPVTWDSHIGPAPEYTVDELWMNRVEEVVDWALARDLYVVLNAHHDSWLWMNLDQSPDREAALDKFDKLWSQIAERFKEKSGKLILEIINEPTDMAPEQMNELNVRILEQIRATGGANGQRLVIVAGLWNDSQKALDHFEAPEDEHIIMTVHYYSPWDFLNNWWARTTWGTDEDKREVDTMFKALHDKFVQAGLPVVIGEYGTTTRIDRRSQLYYYNHIAQTAHRYGMAMMWWDNGEHLHRLLGEWRHEELKDVLVNAGNAVANSFIAPADVYVRSGERAGEVRVALELFGNELEAVSYNGQPLAVGSDYRVDAAAGEVILDAAYMNGLLQPGVNGLNAELRFTFDRGADAVLQLFQYEEPVLETQELALDHSPGTALDVRLQAAMNGTRPAAIRVADAQTGEPVSEPGRHYLRMYDHFDYDSSSIVLKKMFVETVKRDVDVTIEFWPRGVQADLTLKVKGDE